MDFSTERIESDQVNLRIAELERENETLKEALKSAIFALEQGPRGLYNVWWRGQPPKVRSGLIFY